MTAGLTGLPEGQELRPRQRWWRRLTYLPLVMLGILSVLALVAGVVVAASLESRATSPAAVSPVGDWPQTAADALCRPEVATSDDEPWLDDPSSAEAAWQEHADAVAQPYLVGPNGWIFWSDEIDQYASQAVGRVNLSQLDVDRWVDHLTSLRDGFAADGIEFYVIVTPSTSSVYPEELPEWMQALRGSTSMDQLAAAAGGLPLIDLRAGLIEQKSDDAHLFSWSNSHWTDFGAYASWSQISACVNEIYPSERPLQVPPIEGTRVIGDFNEWASFGVESPGADWAVPVYSEPLREVTRTRDDGSVETVPGEATTDASILPVTTEVSESTTGKKALVFRDSMGGGLSPLWQQSYSTTWQFWHRYRADFEDPVSYRDYVAQYAPDVVVLQIAERHLLNAPPSGSGY